MNCIRRRAGWILLLSLVMTTIPLTSLPAVAGSGEAGLDSLLTAAETWYWAGLTERGSMNAYERAEATLERARERVRQLEDGERRRAWSDRIEALAEDVAGQKDIAHNTLFGVFPLSRFLEPTVLMDAGALGSFELIDEPVEVLLGEAAAVYVDQVFSRMKPVQQLHVAFNSSPPSRAWENELRNVFDRDPNFYVLTQDDVTRVLADSLREPFFAGDLPQGVRSALLEGLGIGRVLVMTARYMAEVEDVLFLRIDATLLEQGQQAPASVFRYNALIRDRRDRFGPMLLLHLVLAALALLVTVLVAALRHQARMGWSTVVFPLIGFSVGRAIPWLLTPAMSSLRPEAEVLAVLTFWWPAAVGIVLLLLPYPVLQYGLKRLGALVPLPTLRGRHFPLALAVGMGTAAWLGSVVLLHAPGVGEMLHVIPVVIGTVTVYGLIGEGFDRGRGVLAVPAVILAPVVGVAWAMAAAVPLWGTAAVSLAVAGAAWLLARPRVVEDQAAPSGGEGAYDGLLDTLLQRCRNTPFTPRPFYPQLAERVRPVTEQSRIAWLLLNGTAGVGKTHTAHQLAGEVRRGDGSHGEGWLLEGKCMSEEEASAALEPFRQAMSERFAYVLGRGAAEGEGVLDSALDGILENVAPVLTLLAPADEEAEEREPQSREELYAAIARALQSAARRRPVILLLDDIHDMDPESRDLLRFLWTVLPPGEEGRLLVLMTSREAEPVPGIEWERVRVAIPETTPAERESLLRQSLGVAPEAARHIVDVLGEGIHREGELHWLLEVVAHMGETRALQPGEQGWVLSREARKAERLPVPDHLLDRVSQQLDASSRVRTVVGCAACLGYEFDAEVLARALELPRMELLTDLIHVERESGLVEDVRQRDDLYRFRSQFLLEAVRSILEISGAGPLDSTVPQVVREYHASIAKTLEGMLEEAPGRLGEVAHHYHAAGSAWAARGLTFGLRAARAAAERYHFDEAFAQVSQARECAEVLGREREVELPALELELEAAMVTRRGAGDTSRKGMDYLERHPEASAELRLRVAQVCYIARRFEETRRLCGELLERDTAPDILAEARQFHALSLPRDDSDRVAAELEDARAMAEALPPSEAREGLLARIENSLADTLMFRPDPDLRRARELLESSLERKRALGDKVGQAISLGGLGRMEFFLKDPPDLEAARGYFAQDLELSEEVGDLGGQVIMHSLIGACDLRTGDLEAARAHYEESLGLAQDVVQRTFARMGLLEVALEMGEAAMLNDTGQALLDDVAEGGGVPGPCREDWEKLAPRLAERAGGTWLNRLMALNT